MIITHNALWDLFHKLERKQPLSDDELAQIKSIVFNVIMGHDRATGELAPNHFVVSDMFLSHIVCAVNNLNDLPVNEAWATKWATDTMAYIESIAEESQQ